MIKFGTHSNYSHINDCKMIVRSDIYSSIFNWNLCVWESGWEGMKDPQDGKIKLGVVIDSIT